MGLVQRGLWALLAVAAAAWVGSRSWTRDPSGVSAQAVERARPGWRLQLDGDGAVQLPVERMDIYVIEDEDYPERFEIHGDGLTLVGTLSAAVGYQERFEELIGRPIAITPSGGDPRETRYSVLRLDGRTLAVRSGTFTVERVTGRWAGLEGDRTLWGRVELRVADPSGERVVTGKLAVHAVTWG